MSKHHTSKWLRNSTRLALYLRDDFTCAYCEQKFDRGFLQIDHIIPISKGGSNDTTNLVTACCKCNNEKSAKDIFEYIGYKAAAIIMRVKNTDLTPFRKAALAALKAKKLAA